MSRPNRGASWALVSTRISRTRPCALPALDGSIEALITWHEVSPGDFFYIPANTVHAIGAGVSLIEVQQNSDITYRLYDYGRPRELHLEDGVAVAKGEPYPLEWWSKAVPAHASQLLVNGPLFVLEQVAGSPTAEIAARYPAGLLIIPREGEVQIAGEAIPPCGCGLAGSLADIRFADHGVCLLATPCTRIVWQSQQRLPAQSAFADLSYVRRCSAAV